MTMSIKLTRLVLLLAALAFAALCLPLSASANGSKLVYEVTYTTESLYTPTDWYNSSYFDNPDYKENRFVQYWVETPIAPGGPRDTGFYMVYNNEGLIIFFQSNENETDANGDFLNSSIELFIKYGREYLPYHQMIIHTNGGDAEYYEWQTEYRHNRPLLGHVTYVNEQLPTGWGTTLFIPWEAAYEYVPLNGEDWEFAMIRWSPSHSPTWGGHVHQVGRFNVLDFQAPTAAQRTAIQKSIILKAWQKFNETVAELNATWLNGDADDEYFYYQYVQPLIAQGLANGSQIPDLDTLTAAEIDALYAHVGGWFELDYDVQDARKEYLTDKFLGGQPAPPAVPAPPSGLAAVGKPGGVTLTWSASPSAGVVGYDVYMDNVKLNQEPIAALSYDVNGLSYGTTYEFEVAAVNGSGAASTRISTTGTPSHYLIELDRWGIKNDGTDSANTVSGLNQAIQWAHGEGIDALYLPAGTYLIPPTGKVQLLDGLLFEMDPDAVLQVEANGSPAYEVLYVGPDADDVTIKGGKIVGDRYTHDYAQAPGLHDAGYGIVIHGASNTVVESVYVQHFTGDAIVVRGQAEQTTIRHSELADNRRTGISVNGAVDVVIESNTIHGMDEVHAKAGINVVGTSQNVTIRGNLFFDNDAYDVYLSSGSGAVIENNEFGSAGAVGLAKSASFTGNVTVSGNTFLQTEFKVNGGAQLLDNTMVGGKMRLEGSGVIVDGLEAENTAIMLINQVTDGILFSNVDLTITRSDLDVGLQIWGEAGTHFTNVTISGWPALRSLSGGTTGYHYFDNLQVIGYNPVQGINLPNGEYVNSVFEIGPDGNSFKGGVQLSGGGTYVFDHATFIGNTEGGGGVSGQSDVLDVTITHSTFVVNGEGSAVHIRAAQRVLLQDNDISATGISGSVPLVYIGYYWDRNQPSRVFDVTIDGNAIVTDTPGAIGISTEYAGVDAEPYTVTDNTLTNAILKLKANDVSSGNVLLP